MSNLLIFQEIIDSITHEELATKLGLKELVSEAEKDLC